MLLYLYHLRINDPLISIITGFVFFQSDCAKHNAPSAQAIYPALFLATSQSCLIILKGK